MGRPQIAPVVRARAANTQPISADDDASRSLQREPLRSTTTEHSAVTMNAMYISDAIGTCTYMRRTTSFWSWSGGLITNASFTDYLIPTALDMPPVESVLIEDPEPDAPYGVKGVGEPPTVVSTAAVAAAVRAACGRALTRVPIRPDDVVGL